MPKKTLKDALIDCPITGNVRLNLDLACEVFDKHAYVYQYGDKFRLIQKTPKGRIIKLKVDISTQEARMLIHNLSLITVRDSTLFDITKYYHPERK